MKESKRISDWVASLWAVAHEFWLARKQDENYRSYLVQPFLKELSHALDLPRNLIVIDFGCAEGKETEGLKNVLRSYNPIIYGFDPQLRNKKQNSEVILDGGKWSEFLHKYHLRGKVDLVTCLFVLQELQNMDRVLKQIEQALKPGGLAIFLIVHPDFALAMKDKGALASIFYPAKESQVDWHFGAAYPIVEENCGTFFLPYFHRTIAELRKTVKQHFEVRDLYCLKPSKEVSEICKQNKYSPFFNHPGNVYWPEIIYQESSLLIVASNGVNHEKLFA